MESEVVDHGQGEEDAGELVESFQRTPSSLLLGDDGGGVVAHDWGKVFRFIGGQKLIVFGDLATYGLSMKRVSVVIDSCTSSLE